MLRLGLDIGTNSIGWCVVEYDAEHHVGTRIVDIGVRIFGSSPQGAGRDPKSGASLAVDRRAARAMRRRRDRYLGRRSAFLDTLVRFGLMPADANEAKLVAERDPYDLRARALNERLEPWEIGRALFHLNQRRGFLSNRKAERRQKDGEDGKIASGAKALDQAMAAAGADTLGQFLAGQSEKRVRLDGESQDYDFYPQRRHIDYEFQRIWAEQAKYHPALLTEEARAALHRILFFQRPLKEPEVGVCTFVNTERRLPKAHPLFQERRLYEEVNQLEITTPGEVPRKLTLDQRDHLILMLRGKKEVLFSTLAGGKGLRLQPGESFNKASETRTALRGNEVYAALAHKDRFGAAGWANMTPERQWAIIEMLLSEENPDTLHAFLTGECGLTEDQARATAKTPLPEGYGRLGETATRLILEELKKEVITYDAAVRRAGWHHSDDRTGEILDRLPYYGELLTRDIPPGSQLASDPPEKRWGKITNPTVHIGLRQLEKLVNAVIAVHGRPDEIVVELARELNLSEKDKEEHNRRIRKTTAEAQARSRKLQEEGIEDTGANRAKLKLWQELAGNPVDRFCPYCGDAGKLIGFRALFSQEVDIDHIIPYSRSLDDSANNKVVAHRSCNRAKGNKTPYEKWGHSPERWEKISAQVAHLHRAKQWRFGPDAMERVARDGDFLARQLTDTQYLSRLARKYLLSLYAEKGEGSGHVYVIPGRMTAMLRRLWGLNSLLPDHNYVENEHSNAPKNRLDHRHHAIDATVTAVTTRSLLQLIARTAGEAEDKDLDRLFEGLEQPWEGFREQLGEALASVTVSHKPDHGRKGKPSRHRDVTAGRLHNDTAYGLTGEVAADGKTPIVVHRVPLTNLKPGDLTNPERIPDASLRDALYAATRDATGKEFEAALRRFRETHPVFHGIRRVRVREPLNVIPIRDKTGRAYKAYKGDANARYDVWCLPNGKWVTSWKDRGGCERSSIISMFDAHQSAEEPRPHPAARKVLSLRQNDLLAIERDGGAPEIVRVVKFSTNGSIALAPANEGGALKARDAAPDDPFHYIYSSGGGLKKLKARQIRIDPLGRIFDPGPRG
ncbi:MAG: type II CRISPR RNA-guided endonuclease Cas9 [Sphingobium sp. 66-54]|nr:MAG: type II CRISPR RNA-guided endonuclease Cas9 [Sphingobium sp. 66-54]